ncbi:MAG: hypothetical protein V1800_00960 [Candidatus Latescibacterota bacterium]
MKPFLVCREENDLCRVLRDSDCPFERTVSAEEAVDRAPASSGVLILADRYPEEPTFVDPALLERARRKGQRVYMEYPHAVPEMQVGTICVAGWERAVVASDAFSPYLLASRILMIHGCQYVPVCCKQSHIVLGRVAGFDYALYGLPEETFPILFEHPNGNLLIATTKLSQFVTGRYAPSEAWGAVWQWIMGWVCPAAEIPKLHWALSVCPSHPADGRLPDGVQRSAVCRGVRWFENAKLFIHPTWKDEARRRLLEFHDGTGIGPEKDWPVGDGTCGMIEGASSKVHPDGTQDWRYFLRNDCTGEVAMAMAVGGALLGDPGRKRIAAALNDSIHFNPVFSGGPRSDPDSPSYGLVRWDTRDDGIYYGDDNARSMLGTMAVSATLGETRWDEPLLRCLLANLRTTGPSGFRPDSLNERILQEKGWRHFWTTEHTSFAPHYQSFLWACFFWAYRHTGFSPFLDRARTAVRMTMEAYPSAWRWTNGMQQERARMLLSLSWLVRVDDRPEHRDWLRFMAGQLLDLQDGSGAIREELGASGRGSYGPARTNEEYGTTEAPLIQQNGDPLCDLLYTTNFAFLGLHEAAAATGDSFYAEAEAALAAFLCRIQVKSESHPELDGAWFRAFDFRRWEYWASNADLGWGAWSIESGWTQAWITTILALRQRETSLWELTGDSRIAAHFEKLVAVMLPDA